MVNPSKWRRGVRRVIGAAQKKISMTAAGRRFIQSGPRTACCEQGSAVVEMALVTPIILLLMTGMFSVSVVTYQKLELAEAVSAGARYLAVDRGDTDPCATIASAVYAAAPNLSKTKMSLSFNINGTSYNNTATCSGTSAMVSGASAKLTATYPCVLKWYNMAATTCSLTVSTSEVIQ